eukprot:11131055-Alexandrium_andersonii.AAC.1
MAAAMANASTAQRKQAVQVASPDVVLLHLGAHPLQHLVPLLLGHVGVLPDLFGLHRPPVALFAALVARSQL